jgi:hypothetical protein
VSDKDQKTGFDDDLVTRSYERLKEIQPPESLDRRILAMAAGEANRKRTQRSVGWADWKGWGYRFAAAATIVLTVSVTLRMLTDSRDDEMPQSGSIQSETTLSEERAPHAMSARSTNLAVESDADVPDGREVTQAKVVRQRVESAPAKSDSGAAEIASFIADEEVKPELESSASRDALSGLVASAPDQESLPEAMRQEPDEWLVAIDELLDDGRTQWAGREIALFRERWPDVELDEKYDIE